MHEALQPRCPLDPGAIPIHGARCEAAAPVGPSHALPHPSLPTRSKAGMVPNRGLCLTRMSPIGSGGGGPGSTPVWARCCASVSSRTSDTSLTCMLWTQSEWAGSVGPHGCIFLRSISNWADVGPFGPLSRLTPKLLGRKKRFSDRFEPSWTVFGPCSRQNRRCATPPSTSDPSVNSKGFRTPKPHARVHTLPLATPCGTVG